MKTLHQIAHRHLDAWFAANPVTSTKRLVDYVVEAIAEGQAATARDYMAGNATLRHERDVAVKALADTQLEVVELKALAILKDANVPS